MCSEEGWNRNVEASFVELEQDKIHLGSMLEWNEHG